MVMNFFKVSTLYIAEFISENIYLHFLSFPNTGGGG